MLVSLLFLDKPYWLDVDYTIIFFCLWLNFKQPAREVLLV